MAPYPNAAPPPPPRPPSGTNAIVWLVALMGVGAVIVVGSAVGWAVYQYGRTSHSAGAGTASPASSGGARARLPPVERRVPHHALSVLDGCTDDDLRAVAAGIDSAIDVGAPLYNAGNFAGCYHMYEGTAADVERKLGEACVGPVHALEAGRTRAASLEGPSAQAWAMRDAFDGLLDVIARRDEAPKLRSP